MNSIEHVTFDKAAVNIDLESHSVKLCKMSNIKQLFPLRKISIRKDVNDMKKI